MSAPNVLPNILPNVLIVMADQLTPGALPAYGNRVAKTPFLDALAGAGAVFERAYCNSPLCAPSRMAFMSGRLPSATGGYDNAAEFPSQLPTFAHYLRLAGYRTILAGKMHFCGPDQMHGFEERLTTDIYPADYNWTPDWERPEERPEWYHSMESVTQAGPCVRTNQVDFDEEVGFAARQKLHDIARGSDQRPFCLVVSLTHPHDPFAIPQPYWSRYRDDEVDMPRIAAPPRPDPHSERLRHVFGAALQKVTEAQVRAARHAYYGAVSYLDDQIGALLQTLAETGLGADTVTIVLADHGEMLGERGLWFKMSFFEPACRVPLIVHAPGRFAARRVEAAVSLVDMLPTLAALAHGGREPRLCDAARRTQPVAAPRNRARPRRGDRRVSGRGRARADGDDPPRRLQVHPFAPAIPTSSTTCAPTPTSCTTSPAESNANPGRRPLPRRGSRALGPRPGCRTR